MSRKYSYCNESKIHNNYKNTIKLNVIEFECPFHFCFSFESRNGVSSHRSIVLLYSWLITTERIVLGKLFDPAFSTYVLGCWERSTWEFYGINGNYSHTLPCGCLQTEHHRIGDKRSLMKVRWLHKPNAGPGSSTTTSLKGPIVPRKSLSLSAVKWPLWLAE